MATHKQQWSEFYSADSANPTERDLYMHFNTCDNDVHDATCRGLVRSQRNY